MKRRYIAAGAASILFALFVPLFAFASFADSAESARVSTANLSQQQLDGINKKVFSDAFLVAKIIGYDKAEFDQLKAEVQSLRAENAQLRSQGAGSSIATSEYPSSLEGRVARLESAMLTVQKSLAALLNIFTEVLAAMR
jgi:cell division protein FtsB